MNKKQLIELAKALLVAGGPVVVILVNLFGMNLDQAENLVKGLGALATMIGTVWMVVDKTDYAMLRDASQVDGAVKIKIDPDSASAGALKAAADNTLANVRLAPPPPSD